MKFELNLAEKFGTGLADDALAAEFRMERMDTYASHAPSSC